MKNNTAAAVNVEAALNASTADLVEQVQAISIRTDADYSQAGKLVVQLKAVKDSAAEYWNPLVKAAYQAHKNIKAKYNAIHKPLEDAEKALKNKMSAYTLEVQAREKAKAEALKQAAKAEAERKLDEAADAEAKGDAMGAEMALAEAEVLDGMTVTPGAMTAKADGIHHRRAWKFRITDPSKVPVSFAGVEIRPVDEKAIRKLVNASKGNVQIPGVEVYEDVTIVVG